MTPDEIIRENLSLREKYEGKSVLDMVEHQERLIAEYCAKGYTREHFFRASRHEASRVAVDEPLNIYVVYNKPRDYPNDIVVRAQRARNGVIEVASHPRIFKNLENARLYLESMGLFRIMRDPDDDPVIVETWI